jgi:tetratricopeptide (TPR) repeat protein
MLVRFLVVALLVPVSLAVAVGQQGGSRIGSEDVKQALDLASQELNEIEDPTDRLFALCRLARLQFKHGFKDSALETLRLAENKATLLDIQSEGSHRLAEIAVHYSEFGDTTKAMTMIGALPSVQQHSALRYLSASQVDSGSLKSATITAELIQDDSFRGEAFQRIVTAHAKAGDFETARRVATSIIDTMGKARSWAAIAIAEFKAGNRAAAKESLENAREAASQIVFDPADSSDHKPLMMGELARVLAVFGDFEAANEIASAVPKAPWKDLAWRNIARVQAQDGDVHGAVLTSESIQDKFWRGNSLSLIAFDLIKRNKLDEALKVADINSSEYYRLVSYTRLAKAYARAGKADVSKSLIDTVLTEAVGVADSGPSTGNLKGSLMGRLAWAQTEMGDADAAMAWIPNQPTAKIRFWSYLGIAEGALGEPEFDDE